MRANLGSTARPEVAEILAGSADNLPHYYGLLLVAIPLDFPDPGFNRYHSG